MSDSTNETKPRHRHLTPRQMVAAGVTALALTGGGAYIVKHDATPKNYKNYEKTELLRRTEADKYDSAQEKLTKGSLEPLWDALETYRGSKYDAMRNRVDAEVHNADGSSVINFQYEHKGKTLHISGSFNSLGSGQKGPMHISAYIFNADGFAEYGVSLSPDPKTGAIEANILDYDKLYVTNKSDLSGKGGATASGDKLHFVDVPTEQVADHAVKITHKILNALPNLSD